MALAQQHRLGAMHSSQGRMAQRPSLAAPRPSRQVRAHARLMPRWSDVYSYLKEQELQTIPPEAASELIASGDYAFIDVRLPADHEKVSPWRLLLPWLPWLPCPGHRPKQQRSPRFAAPCALCQPSSSAAAGTDMPGSLPPPPPQAHPAGSTSVPMYQPISNDNMDAAKVMKMIAYRFNGVNPVEPNPAFFEQV